MAIDIQSNSPTDVRAQGRTPSVLCGTDFSPSAARAADVAATWARRQGAPLALAHVSAIPNYPSVSQHLHQEAERLRQHGIDVKEILLDGNADEQLVAQATPETCQLLVVSSLGRRAPERWLLGSVSERTAERATVPTLVVRDAAPFEAWTHSQRPLKVFVAFNFTTTSTAALRWVKELQGMGPCDLVIGYVDWPPEQRNRLGGTGPLPLVGNAPEVQDVLERELKTRVAELLGTQEFRTRVEANWGRPDARLAEMAAEEGADLLVVGSHQYRGFERLWHTSISRGLLHGSSMSVAVVPLATTKARRADIAPPIRRVLVATDFSDASNVAIPHAYSLVRGGGTVHLLHVVHPRELPNGQQPHGPLNRQWEELHASHVQVCAEKLRALIPAEAAAQGICTEVEVAQHHDAAAGICQQAERFGADVLCLATQGRSGLAQILLGSVAQKVITLCQRPLMVIRSQID